MIIDAKNDAMLRSELGKDTILVDYSAPWCPPCNALSPIMIELDRETEGKIKIVKVNCDEMPEAASEAGVMSMPTVILYKDGQPMEKLVGLRPKSVYLRLVEKYM